MSAEPGSAERAAAALIAGLRRTGGSSQTSARCQTRPPARGPTRTATPDPQWLRIDWREHLATADVGGTTVNYVRIGVGGRDRPRLRPRALRLLAELARESPPLRPQPSRAGARSAGLRASPMPPWEISIEACGRLLHEFCTAAGVGDCAVIGNYDGQPLISAEAATTAPDRFAKLVLVSSAGASHARMRREPIEATRRMLAAAAPLLLKAQQRAPSAPRLRDAAFWMILDQPGELPPELLWEFLSGADENGFLPGPFGLHQLRHPRPARGNRDRDADRVGPQRPAHPRIGRAQFGRRLSHSETVIFDRCGHVPMAERPVRFNQVLEAFLARET